MVSFDFRKVFPISFFFSLELKVCRTRSVNFDRTAQQQRPVLTQQIFPAETENRLVQFCKSECFNCFMVLFLAASLAVLLTCIGFIVYLCLNPTMFCDPTDNPITFPEFFAIDTREENETSIIGGP